MARVRRSFELPRRVLILCEGESEYIYINGLKQEIYKREKFQPIELIIYQPKDYSPKGIIKEAKKRIREAKRDKYPFFSIWVVFDKDEHKNIPTAFNLAKNNNPRIEIAFSNICFEIWILLHFEKTSAYFKNSKAIISYLNKKHDFDYSKTKNLYEELKSRINKAIENSEWLVNQNRFDLNNNIPPYELQSYTDFDKLYKYLKNIFDK